MRKALLFIFAIALLAGGAYLLAISLMHPNFYSVVRGAGIAVIFIGLGAYLLWDDFIGRPNRGRKP